MRYIISFCLLALVGCTDESTARRILAFDGATEIQFTGYNWFACSKDDFYHTGFSAKKNGHEISGTVCGGLIFRNSTVRYQ